MDVTLESDVATWCGKMKTASDFKSWMGDLPECLKRIPIIHLAIPGTHDSMSCGISKSSGISPDSSSIVKALGKLFGPVVKTIIFKWCVTQHGTAMTQLLAGIRYFDLRIAVRNPARTLQFVHGMYAEKIELSFLDIKNFLLNHKQEVVVLDIQHFYDFTDEDHKLLQNVLNDYFGDKMCPLPESEDTFHITLEWLIRNKYQMIVIYRNSAEFLSSQLWPSRCWPTPWPETTSTQNLISFLGNKLSQRPQNTGYVTQCVLTPDTWFIIRHPLSDLRKGCAIPCNYAVISWLEQQHPGPVGVNVVITDFFDFDPKKFPFVRTIVLLNQKLIWKYENPCFQK